VTAAPLYDLDRAARAGGWEDDQIETGRSVARILHATAMQYGMRGTPLVPSVFLEDVTDTVATQLYDSGVLENALWLSSMHNSLTDMYRDLCEQVREAKEGQTA
jgi:hypothetical protein